MAIVHAVALADNMHVHAGLGILRTDVGAGEPYVGPARLRQEATDEHSSPRTRPTGPVVAPNSEFSDGPSGVGTGIRSRERPQRPLDITPRLKPAGLAHP